MCYTTMSHINNQKCAKANFTLVTLQVSVADPMVQETCGRLCEHYMKYTYCHDTYSDRTHIQKDYIFRQNSYSKRMHIQKGYIFGWKAYLEGSHIHVQAE